ncbi:MAG: YggS family pyridoxal phosphate-dependent enzyme [Polycyclovorans sp.]|jgi:PLP dependent protein|nr:YggS family pyridoxal phosphate-dependent enzyme [Polycyclovorans sp.]|tara:strand:+ start:5181 stop:5834 length:654 start_codon:yes stop_codon:yes gene_type:complete
MARACSAAGRDAADVTLVAVSKTQPADALRVLAQAGQVAFGENYLQEALTKQAALADLPLQWHFIGPIQSNKTRDIAARFDWVHSVERLKIAQRLNDQRPAEAPPLSVCVQVNVSREASKSGCAPGELAALAAAIAELPRLRLRGLMAIPAPIAQSADPAQPYRLLREAFEALRALGLPVDTLSMGMSDDFELAITHGATHVRVGSALFGPRPSNPL